MVEMAGSPFLFAFPILPPLRSWWIRQADRLFPVSCLISLSYTLYPHGGLTIQKLVWHGVTVLFFAFMYGWIMPWRHHLCWNVDEEGKGRKSCEGGEEMSQKPFCSRQFGIFIFWIMPGMSGGPNPAIPSLLPCSCSPRPGPRSIYVCMALITFSPISPPLYLEIGCGVHCTTSTVETRRCTRLHSQMERPPFCLHRLERLETPKFMFRTWFSPSSASSSMSTEQCSGINGDNSFSLIGIHEILLIPLYRTPGWPGRCRPASVATVAINVFLHPDCSTGGPRGPNS
ncbi:hypothetical protein QBC35DRAFT_287556 [Podospora australis]|uniref:Uncharacterized protein n=1 Tax=Podospora australis TaxID=1536484 RepID=A0AAN6WR96_9PEZI|nr:hypothetical protein QBC35DRAFT_287556 [Podospora australis]